MIVMLLQTAAVTAWIQLFFSAVLAIATVVLAWATLLYVQQTQSQTGEMKKTRKANYRPVVKSTIENWTGLHHRFTFRNTGRGAAHDVTARWGFRDGEYEEKWSNPLIPSGHYHNFKLPFSRDSDQFVTLEDLKTQLDENSVLYFEAEYFDPLGNEYEARQELSVLEIARSGANVEQTQKDELELIRKELEKLNNNI